MAITDLTNLSLKVALPARVNKREREFAGKDLVNSYGVAERFVKNLFIGKQFCYINQESYGFKSNIYNVKLG